MPKFSIILPLRDSGNYLNECIKSILNQTYKDFDLLVLAHDSNPETLSYLRSIKDPRAKIIYAENVDGITGNWARIKDIPKSEYMTIIGYDDVFDWNYLSTINELIEKYPDASLYQVHFRFINSKGGVIRKCKPMPQVMMPWEVVKKYVGIEADLMATGFMMRSKDYEKVGGIPLYANLLFADMEFVIELSRLGYMAISEKECFSYRIHDAATTHNSSLQKYLTGFEQFVHYLIALKKRDSTLANEIEIASRFFLNKCGEYVIIKTLKVKKQNRKTPNVNELIDKLLSYGVTLSGEKALYLRKNKKIILARIIDNSKLLTFLFQNLKKWLRS